MIVINKCDADNVEFETLVGNLRELFGPACALMNIPDRPRQRVSAASSVRSMFQAMSPPDVVMDPGEAGQQVLDAAVEADEALMERYLEGEVLSADELSGAITKAVAAGSLIPIFCTNAKGDVGVSELMDAIAAVAAAPGDIPHLATKDGRRSHPRTESGRTVRRAGLQDPHRPVCRQNELPADLLRQHQEGRQPAKRKRLEKSLKAAQLLEVQGAQHEAITEAGPGDIVADRQGR